MITSLAIMGFIGIIGGVLNFLPNWGIQSIPVIGDMLYTTLVKMVVTWNAFGESFPYAKDLNTIFIWVLGFELSLIGLKIVLGSRLPVRDI